MRISTDNTDIIERSGPHQVIYEVIRIVDSTPLFLEDHLDRMRRSCSLLNFHLPQSKGKTVSQVKQFIHEHGIASGNIRLQYGGRKSREPGKLEIRKIPAVSPDSSQYLNGVVVTTYVGHRKAPNAKQADLSFRKTTDAIIDKTGCFEVLLIDPDGFVTEGSRSNIFFIKNNIIQTPSPSKVLQGITRKKVILLARENRIRLEEKPLHLDELSRFDAVFITGTSPKVLPVRIIDDISFRTDHPLVAKLIALYDRLIIHHTRQYSPGEVNETPCSKLRGVIRHSGGNRNPGPYLTGSRVGARDD